MNNTADAALTDELIVCTRNRPADVARCLESVAAQTRLPGTVRVVDSSDDVDTEEFVRRAAKGWRGPGLVYQRCGPGLTRQRNAGVRAGASDVVHFVDDDVVLEPPYVEAVLRVFEADLSGRVVGVGGLVTNVRHQPAGRWKRLFGLYDDRPGAVLASGRNVLAVGVDADTDVDWLSGCSMSYRRSLFDRQAFDEALPGYGLGEDVDFSYRASRWGRLVVTPSARLVHLQSGMNRLTTAQYTRDELVTRARRVRAGTGRLRMPAYWWSVAGQVGALAVRSVSGSEAGVCRERLVVTVTTAMRVASEQVRGVSQLVPTSIPGRDFPA